MRKLKDSPKKFPLADSHYFNTFLHKKTMNNSV